MNRIGLLGGTFDPVHRGHVALARSAVRELKLSRLIFVPAKISPFKKVRPASPRHRIAMLRLAGKGVSRSSISRYELHSAAPSYAVRTVRHFRKLQPGADLFWVMGSDSLRAFPKWKNWREILSLCRLAVARRQGSKKFPMRFAKKYGERIVALKSAIPGAASTAVREGALDVPPAVLRYIRKHGLYAHGK